jgi:ligand-binding SRPBCC domain-containing protein
VQIKGPYKHWWHEHTFETKGGGTLMRDTVEYEMPLGPIGELAHAWLVRDRIKHIFDFRFRTLAALFPERPMHPVA